VTAGLLDLAVSLAVTGAAVPRMLAITGLSVLFGVALSVFAACLSAMISGSRENLLLGKPTGTKRQVSES
jgi:hypothetical protein